VESPDLSRSIRATFEGPDVGVGWVSVPDLLAVVQGLQDAITVVIEDLWGRSHTRGPVPAEIRQQATMLFGDIMPGSFVATLKLERPTAQQTEMFDVQPQAVERLMDGIQAHAEGRTADLPDEALRSIQALTLRIRRTEGRLVLEGGVSARRVVLSAEMVTPPEVLPPHPRSRQVRLSGRLLEIDYRDHSAEVWDPLGQMTRIRFNEDQGAVIDAARQQHVTVDGIVEIGPSGRAGPVSLQAVTTVGPLDSFWKSASLEQLAEQQGIEPIAQPTALVAPFWKEDDEEDFLTTLRRWRQES